jgi:hypothetical protein
MIRTIVAITCAAAVLAGCATLVTASDQNAPMRMALTDPVEDLTRRADGGDSQALYALSFLKKYGLRGVDADPAGVEALRTRAMRGGTTMITQYIAGLNGSPGRVNMISVPTPGLSPERARMLDLCGLTLLAEMSGPGAMACGSAEAYAALAPAAVLARPRGGLLASMAPPSAPVDPASVLACDDVGPLWTAAARDLQGGDGDIATDATERIIALCGEGEPSWHARVMRALIAVSDEEPTVALAVLKPVPRPAPAPIGGYVSFVAMQAQSVRQDWPAYRIERDTVLRASLAAFGRESGTQAIGDPFEAGGTRVQMFRRASAMAPGLDIVMVALAFPQGERDAPRTFYVTTSVDLIDPSQRAYFLDEYRCDGRSTLEYFGAMRAPPEASAVRGLIERRLKGELEPASASRFDRGVSACQFPAQVAPGLGDS